ncbi:MAG: GGDEF domain-containing protein [Candidatus Aminicenantes bacterium]|nr:MAG: GGDEF domain-containing protein [Candidatus Aminicenantes bacterium]
MAKKPKIVDTDTLDTDEMTLLDKKRAAFLKEKQKTRLNIMLTVIQGSEIDFGKTYNFIKDCIRIGRDQKKNTIAVNDAKVSKVHCEISTIKTNDLEQIVIKDLGSTNGTYVNGELVQQRILTSGDKISVGETVLRFSYNDEIEEEYHSKLFTFAATDALTGLYNRRYILNELDNQHKIAKRNNRVYSVVIIDIDDFKRVNDTYGHPAGDEYLKKVAFIINHSLREQDIPGRVGGEEFLIILPETDIDGAFHLANRIREYIRETPLIYKGNAISATISAGVSQYELNTDAHTLFHWADQALYKAKQSGKNKVIKAALPDSSGSLDLSAASVRHNKKSPIAH